MLARNHFSKLAVVDAQQHRHRRPPCLNRRWQLQMRTAARNQRQMQGWPLKRVSMFPLMGRHAHLVPAPLHKSSRPAEPHRPAYKGFREGRWLSKHRTHGHRRSGRKQRLQVQGWGSGETPSHGGQAMIETNARTLKSRRAEGCKEPKHPLVPEPPLSSKVLGGLS